VVNPAVDISSGSKRYLCKALPFDDDYPSIGIKKWQHDGIYSTVEDKEPPLPNRTCADPIIILG
jgi:hypothetical protein